MSIGGKKGPDLVAAIQGGALDLAAEVLEKIHDTRDAGLRAAAMQRLTLTDPRWREDLMGLSGAAYELAQLQTEMLSRVLGIQRRHADSLQRKIESSLGVRAQGAASASLRGRGAGTTFRLPFRLKNSLGEDGEVRGALDGDALTDGEGERHATKASLLLPSMLSKPGVLPAGTVTRVELVLDCPSAEPGARLQGRYTARVGEVEVLTLFVDLQVD